MTTEERIMEAVDDNITHWCTNCPDADHFIADITGPEEWVCSKLIYPGAYGCLRRDRYKDIQALARQIVDMVEHGEVEVLRRLA